MHKVYILTKLKLNTWTVEITMYLHVSIFMDNVPIFVDILFDQGEKLTCFLINLFTTENLLLAPGNGSGLQLASIKALASSVNRCLGSSIVGGDGGIWLRVLALSSYRQNRKEQLNKDPPNVLPNSYFQDL